MGLEKRNRRIKKKLNISGYRNGGVLGTAATATSCSALTLAFLSALLIIASGTVEAQTVSVLHSFTGAADGANPFDRLIQDRNGNLYGTSEYGGIPGGCFGYGCGTVFKITQAGTFSVLHTFSGGVDGGIPTGGVIQDERGNLYGTTSFGAALYDGTVFEIARDGNVKVLHTFTGSPDGASPIAALVWGGHGKLYGTTSEGGSSGRGTVFKVDTDGTETVVYSFGGVPDGWYPYAGLVRDREGNFYGTTYRGGPHYSGSVFKIDPAGTETVLYNFAGAADGSFPVCSLLRAANGNLYGTTQYTGDFSGYGTVFEVTPSGTETVLHTFEGADGAYPQGVLIRDEQGNFYGTTAQGGAFGNGTVFKLTPAGTETVLHSFTGGADGWFPRAGVLRDRNGNLYGITQWGGAFNYGTVFKLTP